MGNLSIRESDGEDLSIRRSDANYFVLQLFASVFFFLIARNWSYQGKVYIFHDSSCNLINNVLIMFPRTRAKFLILWRISEDFHDIADLIKSLMFEKEAWKNATARKNVIHSRVRRLTRISRI